MTRFPSIRVNQAVGVAAVVALFGCTGPRGLDGDPGAPGPDGQDGQSGQNGRDGQNGQDGQNGSDGVSCWDLDGDGVADLPGEDIDADGVVDVVDCRPEPLYVPSGYTEAGLQVELANPLVDASGVVTVEFTVLDADGRA